MTEKEKLEKIIKKCNDLYWSGQESPVSDIDYDKLVERLRRLDPENALVVKLPEIEVKGKKVVHSKPMLSLAKAYSFEEVLKWCKKVARSENEEFKIQPKYDGLSGKLENGVLSSRGDGKTGEDYSAKLPFIKFEGKAREDGTWLGEMLITDEDFRFMKAAKLKGKSGNEFKNQRNSAAGLIGTDDLEYLARLDEKMKPSGHSLLTFVDYELHSWHVELRDLESRWEKVKSLILKSGYPMDGIVVKLADEAYADSLGCTDHHPKGAIAFKFTNQSAWTKLIGVEWSMGKEQIAAVGVVEPVDISGTTIQHVKLQLTAPKSSKVGFCLADGSLQIGDELLIERAGDIIPHALEMKPGKQRRRVQLEVCPFCGGPVEVKETSVECKNPKCTRKLVEKVQFAMTTLGFKGQGPSWAEKLYKLLGVDSVHKLMTLKEEELRKHPEFGDKLVDVFMKEQKKALREAGKLKALVAMDVPGVGKFVGKKLIESGLLKGASAEELMKLEGVGEKTALEVVEGLRERGEEVERTLSLFSEGEESQKTSGRQVCFTGKMERPRGEMEKLAAERGLTPVGAVAKGVLLVCADPSSSSGKMQKARKLGCEIVSEADFLKMTLRK